MKKQSLNLTKIHAAIFDIDGTMVDNNQFHKQAFEKFCKRYDMPFSDELYFTKISGATNDAIMPKLFGKKLTDEELQKYAEEKEAIYRELYAPHLKPLSGLMELIEELVKRDIKLAVASNAPHINRTFTLKKLGLSDHFLTIVGAEQVKQGKPHPEIFLTVAEKIQVTPEICIVFEDSPKGVKAAKRAKMLTVGLTTSHTPEELEDADIIIEDFSQLVCR